MRREKILFLTLLVWMLGIFPVFGQQGSQYPVFQDPITVVPEIFLREFDPITVFFNKDEGPQQAGPADDPGELMRISPAHPGEFRWLDSKTLQFLPTIAWAPLARIRVSVKGEKQRLVTLMSTPSKIYPAPGRRHLNPIREMTLSFTNALDKKALASMLTFEIRSLPGVNAEDSIWLTSNNFRIKEIERVSLNQKASYQIQFHKAVPYGKQLTMHLRLSLAEGMDGTLAKYKFETKPLFRLIAMGTGSSMYPVAVKGSEYSIEQSINRGRSQQELVLRFSNNLEPMTMEQIKKLVRFKPAVTNLRYNLSGNSISLYFNAQAEKAYQLSLQDVELRDRDDRLLAPFNKASFYFHHPKVQDFLQWKQGKGILEQYGSQQFPMQGRGNQQVDLRIHKLDPLDRNFWPFPSSAVMLDETIRPPGPGEEPPLAQSLRTQISLLGTPLISRMVPLPTKDTSARLSFGLDLKPLFAKISGYGQPGTYLVGYREANSSVQRHYVRVQVTDLSLSTIEDENSIRFVVTSLSTAEPVANAKVRLEGLVQEKGGPRVVSLIEGTTDEAGQFHYQHTDRIKNSIFRIVVEKDQDTLVLNPNQAPPRFINNHWSYGSGGWLSWLTQKPRFYADKEREKAHILTERPIYRPEEVVHIKGYIRTRQQGQIYLSSYNPLKIVVTALDAETEKKWEFGVELTEFGSFYQKFDEKDLPTGNFRASLIDTKKHQTLTTVDFKKEAYRIPRFEIQISGPDKVPLDQPFQLTLTADYYAGGPVVGSDVSWKITQLPYRFYASGYPGFLFSTSERFNRSTSFQALGSGSKKDKTDEYGSAVLEIDPTVETDGLARRYVVEGTVRGADEQTVTAVKQVVAVPAFILGMKVERFFKEQKKIRPEFVILNHRGKPLPGKDFKLKIFQRQWHSYLRESDFTTGKAKYVNEVVDKLILEKELISISGPLVEELEVKEAGVYVVEISARDEMGRLQKITSDFYVAMETPVGWKKPKSYVFDTVLDKSFYNPGEEANLLLKSPFQNARALVVLEGPTENEYHWIDVKNGQAVFTFTVQGNMTPMVPIHVLLMRGRLPHNGPSAYRGQDLYKPITMASTSWARVREKDNKLYIQLKHKKKTLPGEKMPLTIKLKDPDGNPLDGEVTLWLVDRAVLALGKEKRLNPLPAFIDPVSSHIRIRDTRNRIIGEVPQEEDPGGDGVLEKKAKSLFDNTTVRKNFKTVPYYNPSIIVHEGVAEITIQLPDNLTDFAIRAVATDGGARFGAAKSKVSIRLPVIVQSALPRFVRQGDRFKAGAIGRVVEGEGGPGSVEFELEGLITNAEKSQKVQWVKNKPEKFYLPMEVTQQPSLTGKDNTVILRVAVSRDSDDARDAFEIKLPVKPDRFVQRIEQFTTISTKHPVHFPEPPADYQPGTLKQSVLISEDAGLVKMILGLNYLASYPHGCTEQRISRLMPELALKDLKSQVGIDSSPRIPAPVLRNTLDFIGKAQNSQGLFGYWPSSRGYVSLTAYVVEFLTLAQKQGYEIDVDVLKKGRDALREALRSDYSQLIDGNAFLERVEAFNALALSGEFDRSYARDFYARSRNMSLYSEAKMLHSFLKVSPESKQAIELMTKDMWKSLIFKLRGKKEVYQGLQYRSNSFGHGVIHTSEIKTLAMVIRALYRKDPNHPKVRLLVDELINLGEGNGWGNTNSNAAALMALADVMKMPTIRDGHQLKLQFGQEVKQVDTSKKIVTKLEFNTESRGSLTFVAGGKDKMPLVRFSMEYWPSGGEHLQKNNQGFVVDRELIVLQKEEGAPPIIKKVEAAQTIELEMRTLVEEHVRIINPKRRYYVAIIIPFAAGFEPLNPNLETSSPEATPSGTMTRKPDYAIYGDDQVTFYYDALPSGTFDFYFRLRANIEGNFVHPPARAEMMYDEAVRGNSNGTRIQIIPVPVEN